MFNQLFTLRHRQAAARLQAPARPDAADALVLSRFQLHDDALGGAQAQLAAHDPLAPVELGAQTRTRPPSGTACGSSERFSATSIASPGDSRR